MSTEHEATAGTRLAAWGSPRFAVQAATGLTTDNRTARRMLRVAKLHEPLEMLRLCDDGEMQRLWWSGWLELAQERLAGDDNGNG